MTDFKFKTNIKDFRRDLRELGKQFGPRAVRFALSGASAIIRDQAKANAPRASGQLKRAIYHSRSRRSSGRTREVYKIRVRSGKTAKTTKRGRVTDAYYWNWVEQGYWATGRAKRSEAVNKRRIPGQWFFRRAYQTKSAQAVQVFEKRLTIKMAELRDRMITSRVR